MKILVEFDMVDMSMYKHIILFQIMLKKWGWGIRDIKIIKAPNQEGLSIRDHMAYHQEITDKYKERKDEY